MVKVTNPIGDLGGSKVAEVKSWLWANSLGKIFVAAPGEEVKDPVFQIGGPSNEQISTADKVTEGTIEKTSYKEGLQTSPLIVYPSSFFMPITPWINTKLPGPLSVIQNPELLITIIAVVAAAVYTEEDGKNKYSYHKKTLPVKVTDNQEMEDMLFN